MKLLYLHLLMEQKLNIPSTYFSMFFVLVCFCRHHLFCYFQQLGLLRKFYHEGRYTELQMPICGIDVFLQGKKEKPNEFFR